VNKIVENKSLPDYVDVCIVGGGIIGICIALELSKKGQKVLVCEKGHLGCEQSGRNLGWVRQQGRDEAELPLMIESNRLWKSLKDTRRRVCNLSKVELYIWVNQSWLVKNMNHFRN